MNKCEHKTEGEYAICNRCTAFERISRDAKALLVARRVYLDCLLVPGTDLDGAQEDMRILTERLEASVKLADVGNLWD
jgi:hypothetical protein